MIRRVHMVTVSRRRGFVLCCGGTMKQNPRNWTPRVELVTCRVCLYVEAATRNTLESLQQGAWAKLDGEREVKGK